MPPVSDRSGELWDLYRVMLRIRAFEESAALCYRDGEIPGFVHLYVGEEAIATGVCAALRETDVITSTHRGHGHAIAKGADIRSMFAELMGKQTGTCGGLGGSMHIADPTRGIYGANGIVGAGLPIAVGAALAMRLRNEDRLAVAFFGDGAIATGAFHESVNLASLWHLPVLFVCENNGFSEFSPTDSQHPVSIRDRAIGYGIRYAFVDGNDVQEVMLATTGLLDSIRRGEGPALLEAKTLRGRGHYEGDAQRYRDLPYVDFPNDPIVLARQRLMTIVSPADIESAEQAVTEEVAEGVDFARQSLYPTAKNFLELVYAKPRQPLEQVSETVPISRSSDPISVSRVVRLALEEALRDDPNVFLAGIDVGVGGNVFGITRGLAEKFPGRLLDTPISETAIVGSAIGAAMDGMRPVVEIMYLDFVGVCMDQLINQAAKLRFMTGGAVQLPLVIRTQYGIGRSSGAQHSQSLEALLAHIPGLTVVMPATIEDHYGLLRSAIESPDPVVFIENRLLYERKGLAPSDAYRTPLGKAQILKNGSDLTLVAASHATHVAMTVAEDLLAEGIYVEVVDLRTISQLDMDTIARSVGKTGRAAVLTEAVRDFSIAAEVACEITEEMFYDLDAPVLRIGGAYSPVPYSPPLESQWLPDKVSIIEELRRFLMS